MKYYEIAGLLLCFSGMAVGFAATLVILYAQYGRQENQKKK